MVTNMALTVDTDPILKAVNRAQRHISDDFEKQCSKSVLMLSYEFLTGLENLWYKETNSKMHFSDGKFWLVFDTESDYIRFLIRWS